MANGNTGYKRASCVHCMQKSAAHVESKCAGLFIKVSFCLEVILEHDIYSTLVIEDPVVPPSRLV